MTDTDWELTQYEAEAMASAYAALRLTSNEIVMTDDQIAEREEWIADLASREPVDEQFEADLDWWEANR